MADVVQFPARVAKDQFDWSGYEAVPEHTRGAVERYYFNRYAPGGFLTALLSNDLMGAVGRADELNAAALYTICRFVHNRLPTVCWGSPQAVTQWLNTRA